MGDEGTGQVIVSVVPLDAEGTVRVRLESGSTVQEFTARIDQAEMRNDPPAYDFQSMSYRSGLGQPEATLTLSMQLRGEMTHSTTPPPAQTVFSCIPNCAACRAAREGRPWGRMSPYESGSRVDAAWRRAHRAAARREPVRLRPWTQWGGYSAETAWLDDHLGPERLDRPEQQLDPEDQPVYEFEPLEDAREYSSYTDGSMNGADGEARMTGTGKLDP